MVNTHHYNYYDKSYVKKMLYLNLDSKTSLFHQNMMTKKYNEDI